MNQPVRALLKGLPVLAALILGAALVASPASAAGRYVLTPWVDDEVKVEAGGGTIARLAVERQRTFGATVTVTFSVDLAAFGGKVTATGTGCAGAGTVYTCRYTHRFTTAESTRVELGYVAFNAAADTVPASKKIVWRMSSDAADPGQAEQYLTVKGIGKLLSDAYREIPATAGSTVQVPLSVRNAGTTDVVNPALRFRLNATVAPVSLPSNCRRKVVDQNVDYACFFDTTLAAGASYKLSTPLELAVAADSPGGAKMDYSWEPYGRGDRAVWEPGGGPALTLTTTSVAPTGTTNYNSVLISVPGERADDLTLTGGRGRDVGSTVTVTRRRSG